MEERMLQCLNWKPGNMFPQLKVIWLYGDLKKIGPGWLLLLQFNDAKSTETAEFERISVL